jgi:nucleotide-binding universal stress UspA family protein
MKTIKNNKVLIAIDYGPTSKKVAEIGLAFAKSMQAEIILAHVISSPLNYTSTVYDPIMGFSGFGGLDYPTIEQVEKYKEASLDYLKKVRKHLGDENLTILVKEGDYAQTILEIAKEEKVAIIVLGTHSKKWLENILLGNTTKEVLNETNIPLLIIPTKKK